MPTSKLPSKLVNVPSWAIALKGRGVVCNLRPRQRSPREAQRDEATGKNLGDGYYISESITLFLKSLRPGEMIAMLIQGYGTKVGSVVVKLTSIYWDDGHLARLDFDHPEKMSAVNGCPNFWTSMLLAIMRVPADTPVQAEHGAGLFRSLTGNAVPWEEKEIEFLQPGPEHVMAQKKVPVPTIVSCDLHGTPAICIQWYGEADSPFMPQNAQFFFNTMHAWGDPVWMKEPASFRVVFIGQAKHWPIPGTLDHWFAETGSTPESIIVWVMAPKMGTLNPGDIASVLMKTDVLGDRYCGVITPRLYSDLTVRDEVVKAYEANMPFAQKLILNPQIELPPEEIQWVDEWPECKCDGRPFDDLSYVCPQCKRRWWQYNGHFHLWKHVTCRGEWDAIRRQQILKTAGYGFPEQ